MGGPGAKGGGGPKPDLSQVGKGALQVHTGTQGWPQVHRCTVVLRYFLFTSSLLPMVAPKTVPMLKLMILHCDETIKIDSHLFRHPSPSLGRASMRCIWILLLFNSVEEPDHWPYALNVANIYSRLLKLTSPRVNHLKRSQIWKSSENFSRDCSRGG